MLHIVVLVAAVLATTRLTRLIAVDKIMEPLRGWVETKHGATSKINYVISVCYWCLSIWTSALVTAWILAIAAWQHHITWPVAAATWLPATLAVSYATSRLLDFEGV